MAFWRSSKSEPEQSGAGAAAETLTVEAIQAALQDEGFKAKWEAGTEGRSVIRTAAEGMNMSVGLYPSAEDPDRVTSLQFYTGIFAEEKNSVKAMLCANAFNNEYRMAKAIVDSDGDYRLEFDVLCPPGFGTQAFLHNWGVWVRICSTFVSHLRESSV